MDLVILIAPLNSLLKRVKRLAEQSTYQRDFNPALDLEEMLSDQVDGWKVESDNKKKNRSLNLLNLDHGRSHSLV